MKLFEVDEKTREQEKNRPKFTGHSLKNIYKGVRIPWGWYILTTALGIAFYAVSGSVASVTSQIAAGDFSDSSAIIKSASCRSVPEFRDTFWIGQTIN